MWHLTNLMPHAFPRHGRGVFMGVPLHRNSKPVNYNTPAKIAAEFNKSAEYKYGLPAGKLLVYSVLGGAFIALGGLLSLMVAGGMPGIAASNPGIYKFVFGALFPLGLVLVVIGGAELFTSDCAVIPFGILNRRVPVKSLAKVWTIAYGGNFIGALMVAFLFAHQTGILHADPWLSAAQKIGTYKTSGTFAEVFVKGIGANWLVCMAVWLSYGARDVIGKVVAMWFPVMCFVVFGFEHSIANMFFIPTAMLSGASISQYDFLVVNLLPATLGNIIGGALFVALPYWYMFRTGRTEEVTTIELVNEEAEGFTDPEFINKHLN